MADDERSLDRGDEEVAAAAATDPEAFRAVVSDFYRVEVTQATTAQDRMDWTTAWAVTLLAGLLSLTFSSEEIPAFLLLIGVLALCASLFFEVRRYRNYDVWHSRIRLLQENFYANSFDPTGVEHADWREELGEDLRDPTYKMSVHEALSRRIRRVYGLLFVVVGLGWVGKVTLFTPELDWIEAAGLPGVDGLAVAAALGAFYVALVAVALWPGDRQAMGEIREAEPGEWKTGRDR